MISLYLMRHGQAGDAPRDDERRLTERGRDDVRSIARRLAAIETGPAVLLSSPLPRALETACIVAEETGLGAPRVEPDLAPGSAPEFLLALLRGCRGERAIFVGHMPDLGVFAAYLAWGGRGRAVNLTPGSVVRLRIARSSPDLHATLEGVMAPEER